MAVRMYSNEEPENLVPFTQEYHKLKADKVIPPAHLFAFVTGLMSLTQKFVGTSSRNMRHMSKDREAIISILSRMTSEYYYRHILDSSSLEIETGGGYTERNFVGDRPGRYTLSVIFVVHKFEPEAVMDPKPGPRAGRKIHLDWTEKDEEGFSQMRQQTISLVMEQMRYVQDKGIDSDFLTIYVPYWFHALIRPIRTGYYATVEDFEADFRKLRFKELTGNPILGFLSTLHPYYVDLNIKVLAQQRSIEGISENIRCLERSLEKVFAGDHNTITARRNLLEDARKRVLHEQERLHNLKEQLRIEERKRGVPDSRILIQSLEDYEAEMEYEGDTIDASPAMDNGETQQEAQNIEEQSMNTAIGATGIEENTVVMASPCDTSYVNDIISDIPHNYPDLTERWIEADEVELNTTITAGSVVKIWHLPADFVLNRWTTPNMLPFRNHEFFTGSLYVKTQWNIPKTNQFAADFGVVYHWLQRDRPEELVNIWSVSQQPGSQLIGHMKNSDEIEIPFASYLSTIPIQPNGMAKNLYYVSLIMIAQTNFEVATGAVDTATLKVYFKFGKDLTFYGQRQTVDIAPVFEPFPLIHAEPAMFKAAVADVATSAASGLVRGANQVIKGTVKTATKSLLGAVERNVSQGLMGLFSNQDKPLSINNDALHIRTNTNIASGSSQYSADTLRLVQVGSTPHPQFLMGVEKFDSIETLSHTLGFVNSFRTDITMPVGTQLFRAYVQPGLANQILSDAVFPKDHFYNWTPVDHMAGWFANYQMKLHYRFRVVCDGFKTFRFRIAYAPNVTDLTYEDSNSVYYETFDVGPDLNTQQVFDFVVPYINNQHNFNYRSTVDQSAGVAGIICVFLETKITQPAGMFDSFDTLVYKRAAVGDIVFSVPKNNTSMLIYNPSDAPLPEIPDNPPPPPDGPFWTNAWLEFQTTEFNLALPNWNAAIAIRLRGGSTITRFVSSTTSSTPVTFASSDGLIRSVNDHSLVNPAISVVCTGTWNPSTIRIQFFDGVRLIMDAAALANHTVYSYPIQFTGTLVGPTFIEVETGEVIEAAPSMDNGDRREAQTETTDLTSRLVGINEGIHGESHMDLYTNLRRFQSLITKTLEVPETLEKTRVLTLPITFGGPLFRTELNDMQRADKILHIHDAFRFTRGSIRHFYTVHTESFGTLFVRHIPQVLDYPFTDASQDVQAIDTNSGFAESVFSLQQNNTHTVEFPMYLPTACVLNASYLSNERLTQVSQGLGVVEFWWLGPETTLVIDVKRALGDDVVFSMFNGFPLRTNITLGDPNPYYPPAPTFRKKRAINASPAMLGDIEFKNKKLEETLTKLDSAIENFNLIQQTSGVQTLAKMQDAAESVSDFRNYLTSSGGVGSHIATLLLQTGQVINNPTKMTFALSGAQVLVSFGLLNTDMALEFQKLLSRIWTRYIQSPVKETLSAIPAMEENAGLLSETAGVLTTAICSFMNVRSSKKSFVEKLELGFTHGATIQGKIIAFFNRIFEYLKKVTIRITETYFPGSQFHKWLTQDVYSSWNKHAVVFANDLIYGKLCRNPKSVNFVILLVQVGEKLVFDGCKAGKAASPLLRMTQTNLAALKKTASKLARFADEPLVKFDPFCYYIYSKKSQIGKSHILKDISIEIAKANNINLTPAKPIFVIPESEKYWEAYADQEILHFDDFMRIREGECRESDAARLTAIKGCADTTCPIAFDNKGKLIKAKLVACAANMGWPTVNGIYNEVIWNRRNVLYEVLSDMSIYDHCDEHAEFQFGCGYCMEVVDKEKLAAKEHLTFSVRDPRRPHQPQSQHEAVSNPFRRTLTYDEFLVDIKGKAASYLKWQQEDYDKRVAELKDMPKENCGKIVCSDLYQGYEIMTSDEHFNKCIEYLTGYFDDDPNAYGFDIKAEGALFEWLDKFTNKLNNGIFRRIEKEYGRDEVVEHINPSQVYCKATGQILEGVCTHPLEVKEQRVEFLTLNVYTIDGQPSTQCCEACTWKYRERDVMRAYAQWCHDNKKELPLNFPKIWDPKMEFDLATMTVQYSKEPEPGISKGRLLAGILTGAIAAFGIYKAYKYMTDDGSVSCSADMMEKEAKSPVEKTESKPEAEEETELAAHPSIMSSGSVGDKFTRGFKSTRSRVSRKPATKASPAGDSEKEAMLKCYEESIMEMQVVGSKAIARCVCIKDGIFVTQMHSMLTILNTVMKLCDERKAKGDDCMRCEPKVKGGPILHGKLCHMAAMKHHSIICRKKSRGGPVQEMQITMRELFHMNGGTLLVDVDGTDTVYFQIKARHFRTRNIHNYLVSMDNSKYVSLLNTRHYDTGPLSEMYKEKDFEAKNCKEISQVIKYSQGISEWSQEKEVKFMIYGYQTDQINHDRFRTSCGSILYDDSTLKILGFMSAANAKHNYHNAFCIEELEHIEEYFKKVEASWIQSGNEILHLTESKSKIVDIQTGGAMLQTQPYHRLHHSVETTIRPSLCHEVFGPVKRRPCNLSQNGDKGQTAVVEGLKNYVPHKSFPENDIQEAFDDLKHMFRKFCKPVLPVVSKRSLEEAVVGIPGYVPRITMSTSPGFPWCCKPGLKRKSDLLTFDEDHALQWIHPELLFMIEINDKIMAEGHVPTTIHQISLKDERLALEKLNNVRLIQGSPLDFTLSARSYLMDFNLAFQTHRNHLEHQVGINIMSTEWNELARTLLDHSHYICVGDYSKFGPRLLSKFVELSYELMIDWYEFNDSAEHSIIRRMLGKRATNSFNMAFDQVFQLECGSPSGAMNTVIVNSLCNMLYIRCAWIGIMKEKNMALSSLGEFRKHVKFYCYGDDVIFAVKPEIIEIFNNATIHEYFAKYDVKYTDVTKGSEMRKHCTIEEATFLKCAFKKYEDTAIPGGVWICLPDLGDIYDTTNWVRLPKGIRKGANIENLLIKAAVDNCNDAIRKSWFHGKNTFEEFQGNVHKFFRNQPPGLQPEYFNFHGLQREYGYPPKGEELASIITTSRWVDERESDDENFYSDDIM
ncbi:polyprotein [Solenopsis invicta virus 11]|nr:polyprotein [Solenopsis invicta virus 11]